MDFRIRQLEYFLVLAEELHFGKAARALDIAQPTLSFQIKSLESTLGVSLFDRTQRQVLLTPEGHRLREHAKAILEHTHKAIHAVEDPRSDGLTIACGPVGQYTILPDVLRKLRLQHPDIELTILSLSPEEMKLAAVDGTVDILLMTPDWMLPGMEFIGLRSEKLSAVLPENHPAVARGFIALEEFCENKVLVAAVQYCHKHKEFVTGLLARFGLTAELVEAPIAGGIQYAMVAAGRGVALAAGSMARANFPGVKVIPFDRPIHNMELGMVWAKGNEWRALATFRGVVQEVISTQNEMPLAVECHELVAHGYSVARSHV
ncbi:MAG: DNA-binding transcriptional regulator, LysR family [Acidobacteriaceae bacterium]|nr:DNA-binding transcriptional regulator, LysR family [Acidobacteriaceae bacterium]